MHTISNKKAGNLLTMFLIIGFINVKGLLSKNYRFFVILRIPIPTFYNKGAKT